MHKPAFFCMIFLVALSSSGQTNKSYFSAVGSLTLPLGEFYDENSFDRDGYALPGFSAGGQYTLPLWNPYVSMLTEVSVIVNFFNREEAEDNNLYYMTDEPEGGNYLNVPILGGLKVALPLAPQLNFFGIGQLGFNIMNQTRMKGEVVANRSVKLEFDSDVTLALSFGGGITVADRLSFGMRLLHLGEADYDYTVGLTNPTVSFDEERDFTMVVLQFLIGYAF